MEIATKENGELVLVPKKTLKIMEVLDVSTNPEGYPVEYCVISDSGRCRISHGEVQPHARDVLARFHQPRHTLAEKGILRHGAILKKKNKKLA